jgi:drug/metabolite transporter (DMT)-like permease
MPFFGEFCALMTALLWSGSAMTFSKAVNRIGSVNLNISRLLIAAVLLVITILILGISSPVSQSQILFLSLSGMAGLFFGDSFLFKSYEYHSARISMLIMASSPAMTAIIVYFLLGEELSLIAVLGIIITLSGIALVVLERGTGLNERSNIRGIIFAFLGALGQSGALIFARFAFNEGKINGLTATLIRITAAVIVLIPVMFFLGKFNNPIKVFRSDKKALGLTFMGAILGPYLGITFSLLSVMHTKLAIASTLMSITPIPMLVLARIIDKENITWRSVLGTFIAVGGVAMLFLR